jgi:hypothetical protein
MSLEPTDNGGIVRFFPNQMTIASAPSLVNKQALIDAGIPQPDGDFYKCEVIFREYGSQRVLFWSKARWLTPLGEEYDPPRKVDESTLYNFELFEPGQPLPGGGYEFRTVIGKVTPSGTKRDYLVLYAIEG